MEKTKNFIDLTGDEFQGSYGHDYVKELKEPGRYKVRIPNYGFDPFDPNDEEYTSIILNIEYVLFDHSMQIIIAKAKNGKYLDFYYNGNEQCFKVKTWSDEEMTFGESWAEDYILDILPEELRFAFPGDLEDFEE